MKQHISNFCKGPAHPLEACQGQPLANNANNYEEEEDDPFVPEIDAAKHGKYTPLHWASYKGYYKVVWILLKNKIDPLD